MDINVVFKNLIQNEEDVIEILGVQKQVEKPIAC